VLTEFVFTHGRTRTFMCAALAARKYATERAGDLLDFGGPLRRASSAGLFGGPLSAGLCRRASL